MSGRKKILTPKLKLLIKNYNYKGYTQGWISRKLHLSSTTVNHYINGNYPYRKRG